MIIHLIGPECDFFMSEFRDRCWRALVVKTKVNKRMLFMEKWFGFYLVLTYDAGLDPIVVYCCKPRDLNNMFNCHFVMTIEVERYTRFGTVFNKYKYYFREGRDFMKIYSKDNLSAVLKEMKMLPEVTYVGGND